MSNLSLAIGLAVEREEINADGFTSFDPESEREAWFEAYQECQSRSPGFSFGRGGD